MLTILVLSSCLGVLVASSSYNFMDCPGNDGFWTRLVRRCCNSNELPKGCECFDVSDNSDFNNTLLYKPECPSDLGVSFLLYTRSDRSGTTMKIGSISSLFHSSRSTKIIIHGFNSNAFKTDYQDMMNALLDKEDLNVILVNWENGAKGPNYYQCAANTRSLGAMTARLIKEVHDVKHASYQSFHLIGHSLGAHASGIAGEEIQRLTSNVLGRISGLDPAGPLFEWTKPDVRLDETDASFVDVIHANADDLLHAGFGIHRSVGHVDFHPNGGKRQPGCTVKTIPAWDVLSLAKNIGCSHRLVVKLYKDSIKPCTPRANDPCQMGYYAKASCRGEYHPVTSTTSPFCVQ